MSQRISRYPLRAACAIATEAGCAVCSRVSSPEKSRRQPDMNTQRNRFTVTTFGLVCVFGGIASLVDGNDRLAEAGFILGGAMIALNEWWFWRSRS